MNRILLVAAVFGSLTLGACQGGRETLATAPSTDTETPASGRLFYIEPGPNATSEMVLASIEAKPGDVIEFAPGYFELSSGIQITGTEDILIRGAGRDDTVLSFKYSASQEGLLASNVRGITVEDLTVLDPPGDAFKLQGVNWGTLRGVRAIWSSGRHLENEELITADNYKTAMEIGCTDPARHNPGNPNPLETDTTSPDYTVSNASGRYGIYPVNSQNILVEDTISIGASDAGIYVGQTDTAIIRNSIARFNVFGFEIENVRGGEYVDNLSECNTGGFLVYDLDGLTRYGSRTRMYRNVSRNNNTYNFATPGSIISNIPRGSGMITMAYDKIDIFDNTFENNGTAGIIHTSYDLLGVPGDRRLDKYTESVHIWNNRFVNNGNDLPGPDFATILDTQFEQVTSAFPLLVGLKVLAGGGGYRGAHIAWDGYYDEFDADCPYPVDDQGQPVPADAEGKPIQGNQYPNPGCRYNAYKFDENGERKKPQWWFSCIDGDNDFADDSLTFANFKGTKGLDILLDAPPGSLDDVISAAAGIQDFPADLDMSPHQCVETYGRNLDPLPPVVIPPFVPSGTIDPAPPQELVDRLCNATVPAGRINAAAFAVNCPTLDQYHLFSDAQDPRSLPNGQGVPFTMNSKLFSDYSTKFRVAFIPEGQQAIYRDGQDGINATILFPVGTILTKSFAFADEDAGTENVVETRLLIKRQRSDGNSYWDGLVYAWTEVDGRRVAQLKQQGDTVAVSWNYHDADSGKQIVGQTDSYVLPNANQCQICHANDDAETGTAPVGPKARNMNGPYRSDSPIGAGQDGHPVAGHNQIAWWCENGLMKNCPSNLDVDPVTKYANGIERNAIYNKPGDSGYPAGSGEDIEARVRSYLEINCAHCHNSRGLAQNTGFYMDVFRPVNDTYGICKGPTASGSEGRGGREFDIVPQSADDSILPYRLGPEATSLAAKMPPLARSVVHTEGWELIRKWIDTVVDDSYPNADACGSSDDGFEFPLPIRH